MALPTFNPDNAALQFGKNPLDSDLYLAQSRDVLAQQIAATGQLATASLNRLSEKEFEPAAANQTVPTQNVLYENSPGSASQTPTQSSLAASGGQDAPGFSPAASSPESERSSLSDSSASSNRTENNSNTSSTQTATNDTNGTGSDGTNGNSSNGTTGTSQNGTNGTDGASASASDGSGGKDGVNGTGTNGKDGKDGADGTNGTDGTSTTHTDGGNTIIIHNQASASSSSSSSSSSDSHDSNSNNTTTNNVTNNTTNTTTNDSHNTTTINNTHTDDHSQHFLSDNHVLSGPILSNDSILSGNHLNLDLSSTLHATGDVLNQTIAPIFNSTQSILAPITQHLGDTLNQVDTHVLNNVLESTTQLTQQSTSLISDVLQELGGNLSQIGHTNVLSQIEQIVIGTHDTVSNLGSGLTQTIGDILHPVLEAVAEPVISSVTDITHNIDLSQPQNILQPALDTTQTIVTNINNTLENIGHHLQDSLPGLPAVGGNSEGLPALADVLGGNHDHAPLVTVDLLNGQDHQAGSLLNVSTLSSDTSHGTALADVSLLNGNGGAEGQIVNLDGLNQDHASIDLTAQLPIGTDTAHVADIGLNLDNTSDPLAHITVLDAPALNLPSLDAVHTGTDALASSLTTGLATGAQDAAAGLFASGSAVDAHLSSAFSGGVSGGLDLGSVLQDVQHTSQAVLSGADALGDALAGHVQVAANDSAALAQNALNNIAAAPAAVATHVDAGLSGLTHALPHWI